MRLDLNHAQINRHIHSQASIEKCGPTFLFNLHNPKNSSFGGKHEELKLNCKMNLELCSGLDVSGGETIPTLAVPSPICSGKSQRLISGQAGHEEPGSSGACSCEKLLKWNCWTTMKRRRGGIQEKLIESAWEETKMIWEMFEVKNRCFSTRHAKEKKDAHKRGLEALKKPRRWNVI